MKKPGKANTKPLSLKTITLVMLAISAIISVFLLLSMYNTTRSYNDTRIATQKYMDSQDGTVQLKAAIDYLTNQARSFTVTGDTECTMLYYNEVLVTKNRDAAMDALRTQIDDPRILNHLETAMLVSDRLMEIETYAMRLYIYASGNDLNLYPDQLRDIQLAPEDQALTPVNMMIKARDMVFNKDYETLKGQVNTRIELCQDLLNDTMLSQQVASTNRLERLIRSEQRLVMGLMLSLILMALFILMLVVRPLNRYIVNIREEQALEIKGSSELQFLAKTYNAMFEQIQESNKRLSYEASHDSLTGLYNRSAYDRMRESLRDEDVALLIIDVDYFKEINDAHGHDTGDRVLKRVSDVLQRSFRASDMVCRIGGDEFSVIMTHADSSVAPLLKDKISAACLELAQPLEDIPEVSLSVGVAFADVLSDDEDLFKCADMALYQIKAQGRNGCGFYRVKRA
ncbi:MAG: GGDEF domain-containing protein [Clostridia bacterium]|nr:GGDEF domain-containing protein [Clostridia bacterium]